MAPFLNPYIELSHAHPLIITPDEQIGTLNDRNMTNLKQQASLAASLFLEFGSGSGGHLISLAHLYPNTMHIGVEIRFKRAFRTAEKAEVRGITNLRVIRADARMAFKIFDHGLIDRIYINFPDPWPKRRQQKNRLITTQFLDACAALLKANGQLLYKTDHQEYFDQTLEFVNSSARWRLVNKTKDLYSTTLAQASIPTEFELLFRSQGLPIAFLHIEKC